MDFINQLLKNKALDSESFLSLLELYEKLMIHRVFTIKLYDQKNTSILLSAFENNIMNTKIIDKASTIILKCCQKDKKYITIMGIFGINEYCINILSKYMKTTHHSIIKQNLE